MINTLAYLSVEARLGWKGFEKPNNEHPHLEQKS